MILRRNIAAPTTIIPSGRQDMAEMVGTQQALRVSHGGIVAVKNIRDLNAARLS